MTDEQDALTTWTVEAMATSRNGEAGVVKAMLSSPLLTLHVTLHDVPWLNGERASDAEAWALAVLSGSFANLSAELSRQVLDRIHVGPQGQLQ